MSQRTLRDFFTKKPKAVVTNPQPPSTDHIRSNIGISSRTKDDGQASFPHDRGGNGRGNHLQKIAEATIEAISTGRYVLDGQGYDLSAKVAAAKKHVQYFPPDSDILSNWRTISQCSDVPSHAASIAFHEISTLDGAKLLSSTLGPQPAGQSATLPAPRRIGVLNFASAKNPGGGFLKGAQAQEESIARSSTLYPTLMTEVGQQFYKTHKKDQKQGFYTHAMIFSPGVTVFRDDAGGWTAPLDIDVVTSAAVNAGDVRHAIEDDTDVEERIAQVMKERMGRILYLFEREGVRDLVLGSFGTGVFQNKVPLVASIWAELLATDGARFQFSFDRVIFAILGSLTFDDFQRSFQERCSVGHETSP